MKRNHLLLVITSIFICSCQPKTDILDDFKNKNIGHIMLNVSFPFDLMAGTSEDMRAIPNSFIQKTKLEKIFATDYFSDMIKQGEVVREENKIKIESRTFNENGELESGSSFTFHFKDEGRQKKLYAIFLAG